MQQIYQKSLAAKKGTWFLTTSRTLASGDSVDADSPAPVDDPHWEFVLSLMLPMSWGPATLYLQRKRTHP